MTYPEKYPRGYVEVAMREVKAGDMDASEEAFMDGYKHMAGLVNELFTEIRRFDMALLFCVLNRYMDEARSMYPEVDTLAESVAKIVNHDLSFSVKGGEKDDDESKDQH